jgi:hypothetical protein
METKESENRSTAGVWMIIVTVIVLFTVAGITILTVLMYTRSATMVSTPDKNFEDANIEFFEKLPDGEITIVSPSSNGPIEVEQGQFKIEIVPMQRDTSRVADVKNRKEHANGAVLVFACYELLNGDKELGRMLIELLEQHDNGIRYSYPTGEKALFSYVGTSIDISQLAHAADMFLKGNSSEKNLLEEPASQFEWRKKEFGPAETEE